MAKRIEDLTFADDGMFQAVLKDPQICAELVELLLGVKVKQVKYPKLEKVIEPFFTTKGVRLDVYLKDDNRVIDVELQSYEQKALGKRARFYQSMIDIDALMKGEPYDKLKESYILFICKCDPFKNKKGIFYGLPRYTFKNVCQEINLVNLNDKCLKVVYNASAYEAEQDERIKALLRFVQNNEPGTDIFSNRLNALVEKIKKSEKFKQEYIAMNLHDYDMIRKGKEEGIAEGAQQKAVEAAVMLVRKYNATPETAAQDTGAPLDKVQEALSPAQA